MDISLLVSTIKKKDEENIPLYDKQTVIECLNN